jgi:hypothetical protein
MDGVICEERTTFERSLAKPIEGAIEALQGMRAQGYFITIYTSRGWQEYQSTKEWLDRYKVPYDLLLLGKPIYDLYIDDRAIHFTKWSDV